MHILMSRSTLLYEVYNKALNSITDVCQTARTLVREYTKGNNPSRPTRFISKEKELLL